MFTVSIVNLKTLKYRSFLKKKIVLYNICSKCGKENKKKKKKIEKEESIEILKNLGLIKNI